MNEPVSARFVHKTFTFESHASTLPLTVSIPEVLDLQYGMYVWPCAVVLAQYVWIAKEKLQKKTVLELGAGVSLPGVVAAKCGAQVILSDSAELPLCQNNCKRSYVILGSDVFYEPEDFEDVLVTISFLLKRNPYAQFWTTYQERSTDWSVEALLHKWNLNHSSSCKEEPLRTVADVTRQPEGPFCSVFTVCRL
ncbi:hypothetical protein MHYP_G00147850 [Metynnis hypsauchen]